MSNTLWALMGLWAGTSYFNFRLCFSYWQRKYADFGGYTDVNFADDHYWDDFAFSCFMAIIGPVGLIVIFISGGWVYGWDKVYPPDHPRREESLLDYYSWGKH